MKCSTLYVAMLGLALASPLQGQTLQERINHVQKQRAQQRSGSDANSLPRMLGVLLYTDISVSFKDAGARDVFEYLATRLNLNIIGRYIDDANAQGLGIDPEFPITLELENVPALTVLEMALEQVSGYEDATWQFRRGFVELGTKDRLSTSGARFTRIYPIDDLLYEPPTFDDAPTTDLEEIYRRQHRILYGTDGYGYGPGRYGRGYGRGGGGSGGSVRVPSGGYQSGDTTEERAQKIVDLIIDGVEPMAWKSNGGEYASIKFHDGALIVNAPDYIHRQIGGYPRAIKPRPAPPSSKPASGTP